MSAGLVPSRSSVREYCLSPSFWWLLAILSIAWLVETSFQFLRLSSHVLLLGLCVFSFSVLNKDAHHRI